MSLNAKLLTAPFANNMYLDGGLRNYMETFLYKTAAWLYTKRLYIILIHIAATAFVLSRYRELSFMLFNGQ